MPQITPWRSHFRPTQPSNAFALALARLHEQGALTLDLNPEALTSSVLNSYLAVKERAMV
jgi:hypothetical protein